MSKLEKLGAALRTVLASHVGEVGEGRVVSDPGARSDNPYPRDMAGHVSHEGMGSDAVGKLVAGLRGRNEEVPSVRSPAQVRINAMRRSKRRLELSANEGGSPQTYSTGDGGERAALKSNVKEGADALYHFLFDHLEKLSNAPGAYQEHTQRAEPTVGMQQEGAEPCPMHGKGCNNVACRYRDENDSARSRHEKGAALKTVLAAGISSGPPAPVRSAVRKPASPAQVPAGVARMPMGGRPK